MKTIKTVTLAVTVAAGLAVAPLSNAQDAGRPEPLALSLQALAPAPVADMSAPRIAQHVAPGAAATTDWQTWAAARHAEITERVLRETEARIRAGQVRGPERLAARAPR